MTTYNGERFLEKQIDSILCQTIQDFELIVCDDCSSDSTWDILNNYAEDDHRLRIYRNDINIGFKKNFEKAISLCKGDYIALCDQDDIWYPNHLQILVNNIKDKMLSIGNCDIIDQHGKSYNIDYQKSQSYNYKYKYGVKASCRILFSSNPFQGASMMIKKELREIAFPIPEEVKFHDFWFVFLSCFFGGFSYTNIKINHYRMTGNNVTGLRIKQYDKWILFKMFIKLLLFNECPQDRGEAIKTIIDRVKLDSEKKTFLNRSLLVLSVKGNIFTCLQNAPFYIKHFRHILTI